MGEDSNCSIHKMKHEQKTAMRHTLTAPRCSSTVLLSRLTTLSCDSPFFSANTALRYSTSYTDTKQYSTLSTLLP